MAGKNVNLTIQGSNVIMENGILKLTMSQPDGALTGIQYGGMKNLLDTKLTQSQRGYWDINWNLPGGGDQYLLGIENLSPMAFQVDDKYQYSMDNKDGGVHGWISSDPIVGFWIIFPTNEFRNGGPTKQNLTVHTGPAALAESMLFMVGFQVL
ncbi:hypothetical protein MRB53_005863 [Persea americana]|uniref:Uncharacterized protein n=1 Tax=Persea americana TaxID=3435 RepID=A0ACC2MEM3_PERAE|nr:hypothetical protein MRB53_005863 [Persea americana]